MPRSVVFNWKEEAARFAPKLRVLDFSGADRSVDRLDRYDIVLTSYGTLRRDALLLKDVEFEYAILDEAQTIKNASTAAAKAARLIRARHRLALSGTPIENHLGELWSLFEFLNPGLLGTVVCLRAAPWRGRETGSQRDRRPLARHPAVHPAAHESAGRAGAAGPDGADDALRAGRRAARALRRAAGPLPDGAAGPDRARRARTKSKMHVLEALLRLRQAACHPGLIDPRHNDVPSAKFDALLPHLAEVREEGHKALVFSQFTSLLGLLRTRLDETGVPTSISTGARKTGRRWSSGSRPIRRSVCS